VTKLFFVSKVQIFSHGSLLFADNIVIHILEIN